MNLVELRALAAQSESETLEFKQSTGQIGPALKTVCGMLNGALGGDVLIGVDNEGTIRGQQISVRTQEEIAREVQKLDPHPANLVIDTVQIGNGLVAISLSVPGGSGLYTYDGRAYQRIGPTTSVMPQERYHRRVLELHHATQRWENQPVAAGVSLDDLDRDELGRSVDAAIASGRLTPPTDRSAEALLRGFGLIADGSLLNAAVALYGRGDTLRVDYSQFSFRLARFRGLDRLANFIDNRQVWGNAFHLLSMAESFLMAHIPIAGRVVDGRRERVDRPLYPTRVLREALAKAICHRDYGGAGGAVSVAMYDDRLEIANPGSLPFGLTPELLHRPHEPRPWNPLIAGVFFRANVVESWGTGTLNMIDWSRESDAPDPEWFEAGSSTTVTLRPVRMPQLESELESQLKFDDRILATLLFAPRSKRSISESLGQKQVSGPLHRAVRELLAEGFIEQTIPDRPQSRLQQYRLTELGRKRVLAIARTHSANAR